MHFTQVYNYNCQAEALNQKGLSQKKSCERQFFFTPWPKKQYGQTKIKSPFKTQKNQKQAEKLKSRKMKVE